MRVENRGFSLIELMIAVAVLLVILAIAIPGLMGPSRRAANEASAVSSVRTLISAQITYSMIERDREFTTLEGLLAAKLIDEVLGSGNKDNYSFEVTADGDESFTILALPQGPDSGLMKSFFGDESGVIRFQVGGPATKASPPVPGITH